MPFSYDSLVRTFERPGPAYRAKPFWSWNGELEPKELLHQIDCFKEMGMGGYFCHSRVGLKTPYLGEEWFDCIRACVDKGLETGMETWLYDEDRWPSGTVGGLVTQDRSRRMSFIRLRIEEGDAFAFGSDTFCAFAAELDGLTLRAYSEIHPGDATQGRTVLHFVHEYMEPDSFYNDTAYVDTLSREATDAFIRATHDRYGQELAGERLRAVKGIFTDEPHHGPVMCGFSVKNRDAAFLTPYTPGLFERFEARFGYSLKARLPELFLCKDGEKVQPIKWQYNDLLSTLFCENFMQPIHAWCREHGLLFTGHLLHEDTLTAQAAMAGSLIRSYAHMDVPGMDLLGEHNVNYWIAKQVQSAARQNGNPWILSELYGCTGWQMTFENYKSVGDWQALFGVNLRCPHLSWYTMQGEGKRDFPASIGCQSAWYPEFSAVEDYFARIHAFMEPGEPCCDLLVVSPVESVWAQVYTGWADGLDCRDPDILELERQYAAVFHALAGNGIDFDYGDEGVLAERGQVLREDGQAYIEVGDCRYTSILLSGMTTIRSSTVALCHEFIQAGGLVCLAGGSPRYVDAIHRDAAFDFPVKYVDLNAGDLAASLGVAAPVRVQTPAGGNDPAIYRMTRRTGDAYAVFLLNTDRTDSHRVTLRLPETACVERWNPRSGERVRFAAVDGVVEHLFHPCEELLLWLTPENHGLATAPKPGPAVASGSFEGPLPYRLSESNAVALAFVDYRLDDGEWTAYTHILEADRRLREACGLPYRGNEMIQPWADRAPCPAAGRVTLRYPFFVEALPADDLFLVVETPEAFDITVNGKRLAAPVEKRWVDRAFFCLPLPAALLHPGENRVEMTAPFHRRLDLEAVYIAGEFGVRVADGHVFLTERPPAVQPGDLGEQGFPFYTGGFGYGCPLPAVEPGQRLYIRAEAIGAALLKITQGSKKAVLAYPPFEADVTAMAGGEALLEYVMTRQNLFGSAGGGGYAFIQQGMLSPVVWQITQETDG